MEDITIEDVTDALTDSENEGALDMVTALYEKWSKEDGQTIEARIKYATRCAQMVYDAKRHEDVVAWLDGIATKISDDEGPDSEEYAAFVEDEGLETLRANATDRIFGDDEEEDDDYNDDDE